MLGLPVLCMLIFERAIRVSMIERNAPYSASYLAQDAARLGTLVRHVRVSPTSPAGKRVSVHIADAWIERVSEVKYTLLFFRRRTFRKEYRLVVLPGAPTSLNNEFSLADQDASGFTSQSSGLGNPFVLTYDLGKRYQDTMRFLALDGKRIVDTVTFVTL